MISDEFQDLIKRSINSISPKERLYDLIEKVIHEEKINRHDLEYIVKDIDVTNCYWHQYFVIYIKQDVKNSLLDLFKTRDIPISHFDREFIKEYSERFMDCFNRMGCTKYRKLSKEFSDRVGKSNFEAWDKLWKIENIKAEVDRVAMEAQENFATHRYSEEIMECFVSAVSSKSFQNSIDHCQEMYKLGISSVENDLYL